MASENRAVTWRTSFTVPLGENLMIDAEPAAKAETGKSNKNGKSIVRKHTFPR